MSIQLKHNLHAEHEYGDLVSLYVTVNAGGLPCKAGATFPCFSLSICLDKNTHTHKHMHTQKDLRA